MDADLKAHLTEASLAQKPYFEALSYAWGERVFPEALHLPGSIHKITQNLASALRHLRYEDRPRILWIDSVCTAVRRHLCFVHFQV